MTALKQSIRNRSSGWLTAGIIGAVAVIVAVSAIALARSSNGHAAKDGVYFPVARGPLRISVTEPGTIKARQQVVIKNEVEGQTTLLYLVKEGTRVTKGELLAELDASRLQDQRLEKQISLQNVDAQFVQARENLEVVKNQTRSDVSKAELDYRFAQEDLANYQNGEYPKLLKEAQAKINLAEEELKSAEDNLQWSRKLAKEKYISDTELKKDELSYKKSQNQLDLATGEMRLLQEFNYKRKLDELKSNVDQTKLALDRVKLKANADVVQAEANFKAKELEFQHQQAQVAKIDRQIEKTKLIAPVDGLVVYATTGQGGGFRGNSEPLAEGQSIRERQDIIFLPTASSVMAEVKIHESSLDKVTPGLPVLISVDALPGRSFTGFVSRIAPLPDAQSAWMNPDLKLYTTEINIEGDGSQLRTGMSCSAEIVVDQYADAMFIPVQAVIRVGGKPTVYVQEGDDIKPLTVEVGLDNNRFIHVKDGLQVGQRVLLAPPLADATAPADERTLPAAQAPATLPATRQVGPAAQEGGAESDSPSARRRARRAGQGEGAGGGGEGGGAWGANMTPEQREEMRKRFENMSPEERQRMREQWGGGGGGGRRGGPGGGEGGGAGGPGAGGGRPE